MASLRSAAAVGADADFAADAATSGVGVAGLGGLAGSVGAADWLGDAVAVAGRGWSSAADVGCEAAAAESASVRK